MYTIDINFLNDRVAIQGEAEQRTPIADSQFLLYGGIVAVVALAITGGAYFFLDSTLNGLQQEKAQLESEQSSLDSQLKAIEQTEGKIKAVEDRTNGLLSLFVGQIPAYAWLEDLRQRTPNTIQISSITETAGGAATAGAAPERKVTLSGKAVDYKTMNEFLLLVQASPFIDGTKTQLKSARLVVSKPTKPGDSTTTSVDYQIEAVLTSKRANELLPELQKAGADGVIARVNLLKEQGVIK